MVLSKLIVLKRITPNTCFRQLLSRSQLNYTLFSVSWSRFNSSICVERIDNYGVAVSFRKYGTTRVRMSKLAIGEHFIDVQKAPGMEDKVVLVNGGSDKVGLSFVRELLSCGAKAIMIADIDEKKGKEVICRLSEDFGKNRMAFIKTDTVNAKLLRNAFNWTKKHFCKIDIIINISRHIDNEIWERQVERNVKGIIRGTLLGYEFMGVHRNGKGGTVVNIITSSCEDAAKECPIFAGAKHYIIAFGQSMSCRYYKETCVKVLTLCMLEERLIRSSQSGDQNCDCDFANLILNAGTGTVWKR